MRNDSPRDSLEKITLVYNLSSHLHVRQCAVEVGLILLSGLIDFTK